MFRATISTVGGAALYVAVGIAPAGAFTLERHDNPDRPIGSERVGAFDRGIESRRDENGTRVQQNGPFGASSSAIGNLIQVTTGNNATVVLNAKQVNRGNQTVLNGKLNLD